MPARRRQNGGRGLRRGRTVLPEREAQAYLVYRLHGQLIELMANEDKATRYHRLQRRRIDAGDGTGAVLLLLLVVTGASAALAVVSCAGGCFPLTVIAYVAWCPPVRAHPAAVRLLPGRRLERRYGLSTERQHWWTNHVKAAATGTVAGRPRRRWWYALVRWSPECWWVIAAAAFVADYGRRSRNSPPCSCAAVLRREAARPTGTGARLMALAEGAGARVIGRRSSGDSAINPQRPTLRSPESAEHDASCSRTRFSRALGRRDRGDPRPRARASCSSRYLGRIALETVLIALGSSSPIARWPRWPDRSGWRGRMTLRRCRSCSWPRARCRFCSCRSPTACRGARTARRPLRAAADPQCRGVHQRDEAAGRAEPG